MIYAHMQIREAKIILIIYIERCINYPRSNLKHTVIPYLAFLAVPH